MRSGGLHFKLVAPNLALATLAPVRDLIPDARLPVDRDAGDVPANVANANLVTGEELCSDGLHGSPSAHEMTAQTVATINPATTEASESQSSVMVNRNHARCSQMPSVFMPAPKQTAAGGEGIRLRSLRRLIGRPTAAHGWNQDASYSRRLHFRHRLLFRLRRIFRQILAASIFVRRIARPLMAQALAFHLEGSLFRYQLRAL